MAETNAVFYLLAIITSGAHGVPIISNFQNSTLDGTATAVPPIAAC